MPCASEEKQKLLAQVQLTTPLDKQVAQLEYALHAGQEGKSSRTPVAHEDVLARDRHKAELEHQPQAASIVHAEHER